MAKQFREGHIPIHGGVYTAVGVGVAIYSKIVELQNPENTAMTLFFYIGLAIALYGVGKLLLDRRNKVEDVKQAQEEKRFAQQLKEQGHKVAYQQRQTQQQAAQHNVIRCKCGAANWSSSAYCHKCGANLR